MDVDANANAPAPPRRPWPDRDPGAGVVNVRPLKWVYLVVTGGPGNRGWTPAPVTLDGRTMYPLYDTAAEAQATRGWLEAGDPAGRYLVCCLTAQFVKEDL